MKFNDGLEKKVSYKLCLFNWPKKKRFLVKIINCLKKTGKIFKKNLFSESKIEGFIGIVIFDINLKIGYEMQIKVALNSSLFIIIYPYVFKI